MVKDQIHNEAIEAVKLAQDEADSKKKKALEDEARLLKASEKRAKEAKEKSKRERIYDPACDVVFNRPDHAEIFREAITAEGAKDYFAVSSQVATAKKLLSEIAKTRTGSKISATSEDIKKGFNAMLLRKMRIDKGKRDKKVEQDKRLQAKKSWQGFIKGVNAAMKNSGALIKLMENEGKNERIWPEGVSKQAIKSEYDTTILFLNHDIEGLRDLFGLDVEDLSSDVVSEQ